MKTTGLLILGLMGLASMAHAATDETEAAPVASIELKDLKQAMAEKKVTLVDCNTPESFQKGHFPGALSFEAAKDDLAKQLPADKGALVVVYCGSEKCKAYKAGAEALLKLGYTNIKHYRGGLAGWKKAGEALEAVEAPKAENKEGAAK